MEGAHYATGSLYSIKRALYPRIEPEQWWLFQLRVKDATCLVRINGDTVLEYDGLELPAPGPIGAAGPRPRPLDRVQAHSRAADLRAFHTLLGGSAAPRLAVTSSGALAPAFILSVIVSPLTLPV